MKKCELSVVIPIYGCVGALEELYERLSKSLSTISPDYEIILVNDACPQNSWEVIEKICKKDKRVVGIELARNFGQMKAILAGLENVSGKYIFVMDCDLQDRPEEIPNLYHKLLEGYDAVFARRKNRRDKNSKIKVSNLFYKLYTKATGQEYDPALCNFSCVKREVIDNYCLLKEEHRAYVLYLKWMGYKHGYINVEHNERKEGKSSYTFKKRLKYAMDIMFSQSDQLLKVIMFSGIVISFIAFLAIIAIFILHFTINLSMGWPSLIIAIFLTGGINLFALGVVGIYIGNIFVQVKNRPLYFIRQLLNKDDIK